MSKPKAQPARPAKGNKEQRVALVFELKYQKRDELSHRSLLSHVRAYFLRALEKGRYVISITTTREDWSVQDAKDLQPAIAKARRWAKRHLAQLVAYGETRAAGVVSISLDLSHGRKPWRVGLTLIVSIGVPARYQMGSLLQATLALQRRTSLTTARLTSAEDVMAALNQLDEAVRMIPASGLLFLERASRKSRLATAKDWQQGLMEALEDAKAGHFWVFFGLARNGRKIVRTRQSRERERFSLDPNAPNSRCFFGRRGA